MHEISALYRAVDAAEETARRFHISKITGLTLEVGELTGYLPSFFEKYFPEVTEERPLIRGAELKIDIVRGEALCRDCYSMYNVMVNEGCCPRCGSRDKEILGGRDFKVKSIAY